MEGYSAEQASQVTGTEYHTILYWLRSGWIQAGLSPNRKRKPRHPVLFSFADLMDITMMQEMRDHGAPMPRVQKALGYLKQLDSEYDALFQLDATLPPALQQLSVYLDASSDDIRLYHRDQDIVSAAAYHGQTVIHLLILDVKKLRDELATKLACMHAQLEEPAHAAMR